ncbi:MAG: glycosyltransferase [Ignavibacteriales bacterium]
MEVSPKVSIIIPVYNGSDYIREAIDSALAQSYKDIEVIVVNDGSDDAGKTEEICESYKDRILYFYKANGGVASALNFGIQQMTGDYFSWLSHDDVYYPEKIETQVNKLISIKTEDNDVILYSDYELIDEQSKYLGIRRIPNIKSTAMCRALITGHPINGCTILIPKDCFKRVGMFNESLKTTQDYEMWFKLAKNFEFIHIPTILIKSRIHSKQGSKVMNIKHMEECNQYYIWALKEISVSKSSSLVKIFSSFFIAKAAIILKIKGYNEASKYAFRLSLNNLFFN